MTYAPEPSATVTASNRQGKEMVNKNDTSIDLRTGNAVRIGLTWRSPCAGRLGVVSALEPNDAYGPYVIEFEDGFHFRYHRQELEPTETTYFDKPAVRKFSRLARLLFP